MMIKINRNDEYDGANSKKKKKILLHVNMAYKHTESINKLI